MNAQEKKEARAVIQRLLAAGFTVSVNDGEETVLRNATSIPQVLTVMGTTCEDYLEARDANGSYIGVVYLVYGNEPGETLCDHSVSLTAVLEGI